MEVKVKSTNLEKRIIDLMLVDEDLEHYGKLKSGRGGNRPGGAKPKARRYH
jgi:hypothetical protein